MKCLDVVIHPIKVFYELFGGSVTSKGLAEMATEPACISVSLAKAKSALDLTNRQGALSIACEELEILADLLEAYFIPDHAEALQRQAIAIARKLAEKLEQAVSIRQIQAAIEIEFEQFSKTLLSLKNRQLKTDRGLLWSDIMRPSARTVALAIHRYQQCVQNEEQGFQDHIGRTHQKLNITYTSLQRRVYLSEHL